MFRQLLITTALTISVLSLPAAAVTESDFIGSRSPVATAEAKPATVTLPAVSAADAAADRLFESSARPAVLNPKSATQNPK